MRNLRAVAATLKPLFENPELGAMAEICEILQALPDDAARLRVMRWSFARFGGEEFKRAIAEAAPQTAIPTQPAIPVQPSIPAQLNVNHYEPELADEMPVVQQMDRVVDAADLANQVSELKDLFPRRADGTHQLRSV
jgi:hypothetical protein